MTESKLEIVKRYFKYIEQFSTHEADFTAILHPEFRQHEFPNLLNKTGQESDLSHLLKRAEMGKKLISRQSFEIKNQIENGDQLVVESQWFGKMAMDAGPLKSGQEVRAYFCIVLEFKDGKIFRQRNYDCFEPFY